MNRVVLGLLLVSCVLLFPESGVKAQSGSEPASVPVATSADSQNSPEFSSRDESATFKVNINLVLVRVVVRDRNGHAVGNFHKEDFQLLDNNKPQLISHFSVEQPGNEIAREQVAGQPSQPLTGETQPATAPNVPERFVAYVVDDVHLQFGDIAHLRDAAERHFAGLLPTDRAAIFTTSGQGDLDFTDDRAQLHAALLRLQPRPLQAAPSHPCPYMNYYMADMILNKEAGGVQSNDAVQIIANGNADVLFTAAKDAFHCTTGQDPDSPEYGPVFLAQYPTYKTMAVGAARNALSVGEQETLSSMRTLKAAVRRLSGAPGQRSIVLLSPGFLTPRLEYEVSELVDIALRSGVVIGTVDARGLYVPMAGGDASGENSPNMMGAPEEGLYAIDAASANDQVLSVLADATGGVFFHNNNDLLDGLRRTAAAPEFSYVLGFAPQNLKYDGKFHALKVTLKNADKLTLQSRKGYFAPKRIDNPEEQAKQELQNVIFSREELHDLPMDFHTQFFKASETQAKLTVLAHLDAHAFHFRKVDGRNDDELTVASAVFDRNGNFVDGSEKFISLQLKDETLQSRFSPGITMKASFDVKPGSYLVRVVVRNGEGQLSAENGAVEIP